MFEKLKFSIKSEFFKKSLSIFSVFLFLVLFWMAARSCSNHESLKEHNYVIARDNTWYPLQLLGREQYMSGFATDLVQAVAKEEGLRIQLVSADRVQLLDNLEKGYYDGVFSSLTPNVVNEEKYAFSKPIYFIGPVLIVPADSKVASLEDMAGKTLGIRSGASAIFLLSGYPAIVLKTFDNMNTALDQLAGNKIDGVLMESLLAYTYIQGFYSGKLKIVTSPLTSEGIRLITNYDEYGEYLIEAFDRGVESLKEKNLYQTLLKKWELINPELETLTPSEN